MSCNTATHSHNFNTTDISRMLFRVIIRQPRYCVNIPFWSIIPFQIIQLGP
nr:MAG TPA: hypothetical protein [Caudoviricetes sp.]DAS62673.1 MAG TPA: hypothetical protein [Bacteriophage sp.]